MLKTVVANSYVRLCRGLVLVSRPEMPEMPMLRRTKRASWRSCVSDSTHNTYCFVPFAASTSETPVIASRQDGGNPDCCAGTCFGNWILT